MNALQLSLPLIPEDAFLLSDNLAFSNKNGFIQFFNNATGIIYRCLDNDKESLNKYFGSNTISIDNHINYRYVGF
jgi:hypothetical protein